MSSLQSTLSKIMTTLQFSDAPAGGCVVVFHQGEKVAEAAVGNANSISSWSGKTLALNFSTGKGILVTLIHILVSNNLLSYDTPIATYWPDFGVNGKASITLKDVLTHRAGLFNIQAVTEQGADILDWSTMVSRVGQMHPETPLNKTAESCYSALVSGWVLGYLIESVSKKSLNEALSHYLLKPLGIEGQMYFGVPEYKIDKVATLSKYFVQSDQTQTVHNTTSDKQTDQPLNDALKKRNTLKPKLRLDTPAMKAAYKTLPIFPCWQRLIQSNRTKQEGLSAKQTASLSSIETMQLYFSMGSINLLDFKHALVPNGAMGVDYYTPEVLMAKIPAANGVATAYALATMYAMLANKGEWEGQTIICPKVFNEVAAVYVQGSDAVMSPAYPKSMHWRLGYHRLFSRCQPSSRLTGAFGHMGYNGSMAWCDTDRELAVAYVHNYDVTMSTDIRQFAITEAVLQWVNE